MTAGRFLPVAVVAALLLAAVPAGAASLSPQAAQTWTVDPGTTGILIEDHRAPLVEIRLMFPAGRWSPWFQRARYLDEAFAMQLRDPAGTLRARADRLGIDVALATDARMSTLSLGCRKNDLDSVLAFARDVLANRDLDHREVSRRNTERDLEWSAAQKDPSSVLRRTVRRLLFAPGDPRRRSFEKQGHAPGNSNLLAAARDTLVRMPGRVIGVAGDLTRAEAERLASGLLPPPFASPPPPAEPALPPVTPREKRPQQQSVPLARLTQVYMALARESPGLTDPDYPAFLVADHVLGGHFYSRLYVALRHGSGDTYATGTIRETEPALGAYGPWTYSRTANAPAAEGKLREVLRVLHDRGITEKERADAVGYLQGRRAFTAQSPGQVLDRMLWDRSRGLAAGYRDALAERAAALSLDEIDAFIRRFYDPALFTPIRVRQK
jgi:predicted Zn-dependent peptidase